MPTKNKPTSSPTNSKKPASSNKAPAKSTAKKNSPAAANKKADANRVQYEAPKKDNKRAKKENSVLNSIAPYLLMLLALVLLICFFTVHALGHEKEGAGFVGYYIQWVSCGLLGGGAFLAPFVLCFAGITWCLYNIRSKDTPISDEAYDELIRTKRRYTLQVSMALVTMILISAMLGVFSGIDSFSLSDMWSEAAEELNGGGILGGTLAFLMVKAFASVISIIILIPLILVSLILTVGLTPDRLIVFFRYKNKLRKERKEKALLESYNEDEEYYEDEEYEEEYDEDNSESDEKKHKNRLAAAALKNKKSENNTDDDELSKEFLEDDSNEETEMLENNNESDGIINNSDNESNKNNIGEDFGGDPLFDAPGYDNVSNVLLKLDNDNDANAEKLIKEGENNDNAKSGNGRSEDDLNLTLLDEEQVTADAAAVIPDEYQEDAQEAEIETPYVFPPIDMLEMNKNPQDSDHSAELQENAKILKETLKSFKVEIKEISYSRGPTITRYELKPEAGIRVRAIANLVDDIALNLATTGVRIEAPIPNKPAVGIEVPNRERATVYLRDLIESPKFTNSKSKLTSSLGMDVGGNPIYFDIAKMPHLLIAGATGMGKSVCINSVIVSLLYKAKPDEVKLILIDPKKVEFNIYKDIPHLYAPIVSDPKKAAGALASAVSEMERRFELIEEVGVRDIATYNAVTENDPEKEFMPQMVIIIDELADLMMTAPDEVESSICRLAQKARAAGIHIIIGTQRPSVDVITGLIKANIPSRIACTVASQIDSRTILDSAGAEKLIGRGDMLFAPVGSSKPMRVQGAFVSEAEVEKIVTFIKENNTKAKYNAEFVSKIEEEAAKCGMSKKGGAAGGASGGAELDGAVEGDDEKFREAVLLAIEEGKISTSLMQRKLKVGYGRAAKIIDTMEEMGYVSKPDGNKARRILITMDEYVRRVVNNDLGGEETDEDSSEE